ncbi:MAG: hypothetical protein NTY08_14285 [Proteobacteria bacterium]|nr:hypothetical protein [Pseudomonadota bacterium]
MKRKLVALTFGGVALFSHVGCKNPTNSESKARDSSVKSRVGNATEEQESPAYKAFVSEFVAIKNADDFAALVGKLQRDYNTYPVDLKFVAAQLIPLSGLRGLGYLVHNLAVQSKVTDSLAVTGLMVTASGINLFSPPPANGGTGTAAWSAIFDYLTMPFAGVSEKFKSVRDLQAFIHTNLVANKALDTAISRISELNITANTPVVWDNRLVYGANGFADSQDRFVTLTDSEKNVAIAGLHSIYHNTLVFLSYNYDDSIKAMDKVGRLVGLDVVLPGQPDGVAAQDRAKIIRSFPALFTALPAAAEYMPAAYAHLKASVDAVGEAWRATKAQGNNSSNDFQLLSPAKILPWQRINDVSLSNIRALVNGQPVRSAVTGETVTMNIPAFYNNPPQNMQAFLPVAFKAGDHNIVVAGQTTRNYHYGEAELWDVNAFKPYMPGVNSSTDVARDIRILGQVWGGWFASVPTVAMTIAM